MTEGKDNRKRFECEGCGKWYYNHKSMCKHIKKEHQDIYWNSKNNYWNNF